MTGLQPRSRRLSSVIALSTLLAVPLAASAADLVIAWEEGFYPEEDQAVEAVVAAYEQETGQDVEWTFYPQDEVIGEVLAALDAGTPPDLLVSLVGSSNLPRWAHDDMLADLSDVLGPIESQFYPGVLDNVRLLNGETGATAYYAVPIAQFGHYIHVWKSLLGQAGISLEDVPEEWDAFWAFWCDTVQPAVRQATGREDFWGIGLPMSVDASDTLTGLDQFRGAHGVNYLSSDGALLLDDPAVKEKVATVLADYTAVWNNGCTPPDSVEWTNIDNNKNFHDQRVAMTINSTLSITNALRPERADDYYENTTTITWPKGPGGEPYGIETGFIRAVIFKDAEHADAAKDFLRFLLSEGRLGGYIEASLGRGLPTMPALLETPYWQDPKDPHRTAAASQLGQPVAPIYANLNLKYGQVEEEAVWETAVHRIAAEGLTPEQATDEAIARIKQILAE